jgi:hypothetical protein
MLDTFGTGQGYLKAGFLGFAKSGKTHTAGLLAIQLFKMLKLKNPIAIFDTEASGEYVNKLIVNRIDKSLVGRKSRSLGDLLKMAVECESGAADILIVDSITHVWREACAAYLVQVNQARDARGLPRRTRLEFQDWANIKERWSQWTDFYLNSKLHIIICGRAGFEWDFEETENADGSVKKELVKTGIKMKVESEFGFEPSLLVEMERVQVPAADSPDRFRLMHRARVLGDRFDVMDGAVTDNPKGEWFLPHLQCLSPGAVNVVDTAVKTDMGVDDSGDAQFQQQRREKTKLLEEIQGEMVAAWPGQSKEEKKAKVECLAACFSTKSWTAVEGLSAAVLRSGLAAVRAYAAEHRANGKEE